MWSQMWRCTYSANSGALEKWSPMELAELHVLINQQVQVQLETLSQKLKWIEGDTCQWLLASASVHRHVHIYLQTTCVHTHMSTHTQTLSIENCSKVRLVFMRILCFRNIIFTVYINNKVIGLVQFFYLCKKYVNREFKHLPGKIIDGVGIKYLAYPYIRHTLLLFSPFLLVCFLITHISFLINNKAPKLIKGKNDK